VSSKIVIQLAATVLLIALNNVAIAQPAVTPLPQANQPQISEQTKALFRQRWADGAAAAANNSVSTTSAQTAQPGGVSATVSNPVTVVQTAPPFVPATATASPSAANAPLENRANQQAFIDKINQAMKGQ
jgi:hypothetical protein